MRPIPNPKGLPLFGTMLSIMASGGAPKFHLYVEKRHRELGPIYREKIGPVDGVFVSDGNYMRKIFSAEGKYPRHVVPESWLFYNKLYQYKRGLFFMDGEEWLKYRRIMNNVMLKVGQEAFHQSCDEVATDLIKSWEKGGPVKQLETQLYEWSLKAMIAVLLGCDNYSAYKSHLHSSIQQLATTVHQIFVESASLSLIPVNVAIKLNLPVWKRFVKAVTSTIEKGNNLMNELLQIQKLQPDETSLISKMINAGVDAEYLKRIAVDLILAAGDTTAHTTQWLLHLLSTNPKAQNEIYNQVKSYPENEDISQCRILKGALKEALRLCPVAPFLTRFMPEDVVVDDYRIKAQELVIMSLYTSGRNEQNFSNADSFNPQRWIRDGGETGVKNPNAYLPFAMGSRSCVGKKMAETQILLTVSKILKNFLIESNQKKRIDITLHLIAVPAEPVNVILKPRTSANLS